MLLNKEALEKAIEMTIALTPGVGESPKAYEQRIISASTKLVKGIRDQNFRLVVAELLLQELVYTERLKNLEYPKLKRFAWILEQCVVQVCFSKTQLGQILVVAKLAQSSCPEVEGLINRINQKITKGIWLPSRVPDPKGEIWEAVLKVGDANYNSVYV